MQASVKNQGYTSSLSMFTRFMFHFFQEVNTVTLTKNLKKELKWRTLLSLQSCRFWANIKLYYASFPVIFIDNPRTLYSNGFTKNQSLFFLDT